MTQPDSDSRKALIERAEEAIIALLSPFWSKEEKKNAAALLRSTLRQADEEITKLYRERMQVDRALASVHEEIERVKKEWDAAARDRAMALEAGLLFEQAAIADRASLSAATLRNEKLREALKDSVENGLIYWEPNTERGSVQKALMLARIDAALQLSPDPATPQETKA